MDTEDLAARFRYQAVRLTHKASTAHLASALSCIDIIAVLFSQILNLPTSKDLNRDRFILSKGHAAVALYLALAHKGFIEEEELETYGEKGSLLEEHPSPKLAGVEAATGSLGHGLAIANGFALGAKIQKKSSKSYVLMSDGENNEGSVWEAAMFSSKHALDNLTGFVDFNKWQATGRSEEVLSLGPLADKWASFGWDVIEIDGHNHREIKESVTRKRTGLPRVIIAHTTKGKGVSFMEDDNNWHYRNPTADEVEIARMELGQ
jgi:transketolase